MPLPNNPNRNHLIDLLRFLAAAWVALFHFNEPQKYIDNWYRNFCKLGYWGVPIFFIISGYCICIAQQHTKTPQKFITRRLFRIFPPYWFSLVIVCLCALAIKIITHTNPTPLPKHIDETLAIVVLYTSPLSNYSTINWVYWTLPFELFFYFIIFFTLFTNHKLRLLIPFLLVITGFVIPFQKEGLLFFFNELPTFMLGYALYLVLKAPDNRVVNTAFFILSAIALYFKHPGFDYILTAFIVCFLIALESRFHLKNNFFSRLGDFSYSIYLIHVPVAIYLLGFIKSNLSIQTNLPLNIITDFFLLTVVIILSKLMFIWVELPAIKLGRKLSRP